MSVWMTALSKYWIHPIVHFCFHHKKKKKKVFVEKVEALFCHTKSFDNISEIIYNLQVNISANGTNRLPVQSVGDGENLK